MSLNTAILSRDNPELLALEDAYSKLNLFEQSMWRTWADQIDITRFRGEGAYLSQMMGMTVQRYQNTFDYLASLGEDQTIRLLGEDDAFGCETFRRDGVVFSRDLLDSVCELRFLRETLGLNVETGAVLLDFGAGYGRLAYRYIQEFPHSFVHCYDAVPLSTFLCDFYLHYRGCRGDQVYVHHLNQVQVMVPTRADIASNVYGFSEMPLSAVKFWLDFCADLNVRYLFLVPHAADLVHPTFLTTEPDGTHLDYLPLFAEHGYKLERERYKFPVEMSDQLIYNTKHMLFRRG